VVQTLGAGHAGWATSGDVNLGTGGTGPLSGNYALLGYDVTYGTSSINQSFAIPVGTDRLEVAFSYSFSGFDTSSWSSDTASAYLRQYVGVLPIATNEFIELTSSGWGQGTYHGVVNVADWLIFDATTGNLRFSLSESLGQTNTTFAIDNVSVASVPEPTSLLLLGLGLLGIAGFRRKK
jgi:hypothetical protein